MYIKISLKLLLISCQSYSSGICLICLRAETLMTESEFLQYVIKIENKFEGRGLLTNTLHIVFFSYHLVRTKILSELHKL